MKLTPIRFIQEPIEVQFDSLPVIEKKPSCPDRFIWRGEQFQITETLNEWFDFQRKGRMRRNMKPEHAASAERRGSWGVGQFHFRVRTHSNRIFDLYYDRAPKDVDNRKGNWFLYRELALSSEKPNH